MSDVIILIAVAIPEDVHKGIMSMDMHPEDIGDELYSAATSMDLRDGLWEIPEKNWEALESLIHAFFMENVHDKD